MKSPRTSYETWGAQILHVPNLGQEEIGSKKGADQIGIHRYRLRTNGIFGGTIILPQDLEAAAKELDEYHRGLGINDASEGRIISVNTEGRPFMHAFMEALRENTQGIRSRIKEACEGGILLPFIVSKECEEAADLLGLSIDTDAARAEMANNKLIALSNLKEHGVKVPRQIGFKNNQEAREAYEKLKREGIHKMFAKANRGASGKGIYCIKSEADLEKFLALEEAQETMRGNGFAMQEGIHYTHSPSAIFHIKEKLEDSILIANGEQLLAKKNESDDVPTVHQGNSGRLSDALWEESGFKEGVEKTMAWLHEIGAYGHAGVDGLILRDEDGNLDYRIIEINFRLTGQSAGSMIGRDLEADYFGSNNNIHVPEGMTMQDYIGHLESKNIHFDPNNQRGVYIVNHAPLEGREPKIQIGIAADSREELERMMTLAHPIGNQELRRSA